jgi:hypothetical protein
MVSALVNGVKGGRWFSLIDKVWAPATLAAAWAKVRVNGGAAGIEKWPRYELCQPWPPRAASIFATSIFHIVIIASNTRLATALSGSASPSFNWRGVICQQ